MTHSLKLNAKEAFSLVELSIVLVILGLLVGGVLSGQSLIRASELRSVTVDYQKYATAIGSFRDKYFALPGDMNNASNFGWKDAGGNLVGNGDGNGQINQVASSTANEISTFWVELASASLVEGSFTMPTTAYTTLTAGTNNPRAKMNNGAWNIIGLGTVSTAGVPSYTNATTPTATTFYSNSYGNALIFGTGTNAQSPGAILKPEEAWNIDTKMDDGKPDIGTVTVLVSNGSATLGSGCVNTAPAAGGTHPNVYDLTTQSLTCSLVFKSGY